MQIPPASIILFVFLENSSCAVHKTFNTMNFLMAKISHCKRPSTLEMAYLNGLLSLVVRHKFIDVTEMLAVCIIKVLSDLVGRY